MSLSKATRRPIACASFMGRRNNRYDNLAGLTIDKQLRGRHIGASGLSGEKARAIGTSLDVESLRHYGCILSERLFHMTSGYRR